jgi:integrase
MQWLNLYKAPPTKKATTYSGYLHTFERHFEGYFGDMTLSDITRETVQGYYLAKQMDGARCDGKNGSLSPKTIRNHHMLLNDFFDYAADRYKLPENPALKTDRPQVITPQMRVLDPDEMRIFLYEVLRETQRTAILFDLFTGLRVGELLAAQVDDIDLKNQAIMIRRNVTRVRTEAIDLKNPRVSVQNYNPVNKTHLVVQDTPKTKNGERLIPISDELFALLAKHLYYLEQSNWPNPHNLLFPSAKGTYIDPKSFEIRLAAISKRCELRKVNPHALRHTFATRLVEQGVPLTTIMELMGHASVSTTQRYITTLVEEKRGAIDKISSLLRSDSLFTEQNLNGAKRRMKFSDVRLPSWLQNEQQTAQNEA